MVHLKASIVYSKVEVLKPPPLALHAYLTRVIPTRVLGYEEREAGVLSIRKVGRCGGVEACLRLLAFF